MYIVIQSRFKMILRHVYVLALKNLLDAIGGATRSAFLAWIAKNKARCGFYI